MTLEQIDHYIKYFEKRKIREEKRLVNAKNELSITIAAIENLQKEKLNFNK